eukprot:GHVR01078038.1.p2 GENE.GHVR01078038.1~~GHVR01078038.1.p2  ORF type:complete len:189 (+),score=34.94 GHVR01078038.1:1650-2216(+)
MWSMEVEEKTNAEIAEAEAKKKSFLGEFDRRASTGNMPRLGIDDEKKEAQSAPEILKRAELDSLSAHLKSVSAQCKVKNAELKVLDCEIAEKLFDETAQNLGELRDNRAAEIDARRKEMIAREEEARVIEKLVEAKKEEFVALQRAVDTLRKGGKGTNRESNELIERVHELEMLNEARKKELDRLARE